MQGSANSITSRLAACKRTGDPLALWPRVRLEDWHAAHRNITAVTQAVLNPTVVRPRLEASGASDVAATGIAAYVSGMGPLLGYWIEQNLIDADERVAELLARHLDHGRRRADQRLLELVRILEALDERGVTPTVLKGAYTSLYYFPEPGTRPTADIDLLIPPNQYARGREALQAAGLVELGAPAPGQTVWARGGASQTVHSLELDHVSNPWTVDLHTSVDRRYFWGLWASFGDLQHTQGRPWDVEGQRARVFKQPLFTAHLAQHASYRIHETQLVRLVELVLVLRQDRASGTLSWEALDRLLTRTGTARFVYPALELSERLAPGTVDPGFRRWLSGAATPRARRVVNRIAASNMQLLRHHSLDERTMFARGPAELARSILTLLWAADSVTDRWRHYQRWLRMLLGRRLSPRA
jgi:hypothetical protein